MATWYKWHLGEPVDNPMADAALTLVDELFGYELTAAGNPPDFVVFKRLETKNHLHCDLVLYFSPAAHGLAELFQAEPCEKPARAGLEIYFTYDYDDQVWSHLFPEGD